MNTPNANTAYRLCAALLSVLCIQDVSARCGSVDYSWGADGLAEATAFVGTMMIYIVEILYAIAGIVVIVAALQIGIKMNYHEGDITKSMMMLFGGILFMIGASIVMPTPPSQYFFIHVVRSIEPCFTISQSCMP
jgi:hypothetical protein